IRYWLIMRVIHLSDTHLGHSAYNKIDPQSGLNQREVDFYSAFNQIIGYILEAKPDLVIHSGDLFDSIRPSNRAIHEAFSQFARLSRAEIPTVIIAGNHSTPRQKETGSIFRLFEYLPQIHPVFEGEYKTLEIGDTKIHAIPHPYNEDMFKENFSKLKTDKKFKYNILMTHATVIGVTAFAGAEYKELSIPPSVLSKDFDYIALGHIHRFIEVADNAYYSGSPERLSFSEADDKKGFLEVELGSVSVKHIETKTRDMIDIKPIDCANLDASHIMKAVEASLPIDISGKILRMTFQDILPHVYTSLDFKKIDELTSSALHCEKHFEKKSAGIKSVTTSRIGALAEEFSAFVKNQNMDDEQKKRMEKIGLGYLEEAEPEVEEQ
ncbi:MAG: metallophosphoesterase family protein, partial [Rhabdochlamydiaceae bacterium]